MHPRGSDVTPTGQLKSGSTGWPTRSTLPLFPCSTTFTRSCVGAIAKAHDALKRELTKLRAGRASPALLDGIRVDYYGTPTPLAQMAHINVPEPRLITVKPWDKTQIKAVEKALRESDLGLNPQVDGDLVRIPLPPLTEERRKEFVKIARKYGEECKVAIRKARHDALDMLDAASRPTATRAPTRSTAARRRSRRRWPKRVEAGRRDRRAQGKGHPRGLRLARLDSGHLADGSTCA